MKKVKKFAVLFCAGGLIYVVIELLARGHTHWSMFIAGGAAFILCGLVNEAFTFDMSLALQGVICGAIITGVEYITGQIVNIRLGWGVWDYSGLRFNLQGQICIKYSLLWILLGTAAVIIDDYLRFLLFGEEKPHYRIL